MRLRTLRLALVPALCAAGAVVAPASALAEGGGTAAPPPPPPTGGAPADPAATLVTTPGPLVGRPMRFRGNIGAGGATVTVQRLDPLAGWVTTATAVSAPDGSFVARWRADRVGKFAMRALAGGDGARAASAPLTADVSVYRAARATWYGPGFYGRRTACGVKLTRETLGVAHRTLPCGTPVQVFYRGRSLVVPVVDRGPFANGAHYDLTGAAAKALGLTVTGSIGAIALRGAPPAPVAP
jgi:hypothetical protein